MLHAIERRLLWLSSWMIHHANNIRDNRDGLKVGGHQASCASCLSIMTALFFDALRPQDRVAVKPHAAPVFYAINHLLGRVPAEKLTTLRQLGGLQPYPSRLRDPNVDFSTGSVGLGVAITSFASLIQDYLRLKGMLGAGVQQGRMVAIAGDAELDEGNIYEALLEGWKQEVRDVWWVVDYNRQSLDSIVPDRLFNQIHGLFDDMGWRVVTLKYGRLMEQAFLRDGGEALRRWIDDCPNSLYSALTFQGGAAWREALGADFGRDRAARALLDSYDDAALAGLMTNLGGHDLGLLVDSFRQLAASGDQPTCVIAYTIKGMGLPFAGHKDNHAGLMTEEQISGFRESMKIPPGSEWDPFAATDVPAEQLKRFIAGVPWAQDLPGGTPGTRRVPAPTIAIPDLPVPGAPGRRMSTQQGFGDIFGEIGRPAGKYAELAARILTTSPDVTVSTNLGPWVNRRGVFSRLERNDVFRDQKVISAQRWGMRPAGQHVELGIAEQNLFLLLSAAGLAHDLFGARLFPVGTVYDTFVQRGLDSMYYGSYQDSRFLLVSTPSGITLAPEGGQHQSVLTPLIGIGHDRLDFFEPAYVDELSAILTYALRTMQEPNGHSVWLRLSTRPLVQPDRVLDRDSVVKGAYWAVPPAPDAALAVVYQGPVAPEAKAAFEEIRAEVPGAGLLAVTSPDLLHGHWTAAQKARAAGERGAVAHIETLLAALPPEAALVTVLDGHPATLSWLGGVRGQRTQALGVETFGQGGDIPDLYRVYGLDLDAILDATAAALVGRR
ncbi:MAG: transketolase [Acetobacteraceae bacterium]|nr:transketolase [Acetobacteraceae bacterium]